MTRGNPTPNIGHTPPVPAAFAQIAGMPADQDVPVWSAANGYASWDTAPGGSIPQTRAQYGGNAVTIANGATGTITWDTKFLGDALLDLTDPANPAVVTAGVYAVTATVKSSAALTAGGTAEVILNLDNDNDDPNAASVFPSGLNNMIGAVTVVYYVPAAGTLEIQVKNFDGAASRDYNLAIATVQRLS